MKLYILAMLACTIIMVYASDNDSQTKEDLVNDEVSSEPRAKRGAALEIARRDKQIALRNHKIRRQNAYISALARSKAIREQRINRKKNTIKKLRSAVQQKKRVAAYRLNAKKRTIAKLRAQIRRQNQLLGGRLSAKKRVIAKLRKNVRDEKHVIAKLRGGKKSKKH